MHIVDSAAEAAEREVTNRPDWFSESESLLMSLIENRNVAQTNFIIRLMQPKKLSEKQ
jgi:hypothetical protein